MSLTTPGISVSTDPRMLDRVTLDMSQKAVDGLEWLDACYGKAEERVKVKDGKQYVYPAVFHDKEYLDMLPGAVTDARGNPHNYGFFHLNGPMSIEYYQAMHQWVEARISLIIWFDLRTVYPDDHNVRSLENVKAEVIRFLNIPKFQTTTLRWKLEAIEEKGRRVYREYSYKEIDYQDLMRPNGALRFDLWVRWLEKCPDPRIT